MNFKKNLFCMILVFIVTLSSAAVFNYYEDPAGLFRSTRYEEGIATLLLENKNVANVSNCDERLLQKYLIQKMQSPYDVLVLGSSRTLQINKNMFSNQTFFNSSVSAASLEDMMAIFEMYREKNLLPQKIVLGVDPWIFNKNNTISAWKTLSTEYVQSVEDFGGQIENHNMTFANNVGYKKYLELISLQYLKASYKKAKKPEKEEIDYYATEQIKIDDNVKLADGSLSYPASVRDMSVDGAYSEAVNFANQQPITFLGQYNAFDDTSVKNFEAFVNYLQAQNIEVVFFLAPYHPVVYNAFENPKYKMVLQAEEYFRAFADQHQIRVIGSYNPEVCRLNNTDFYDGMHPRRAAIENIFENNGVN